MLATFVLFYCLCTWIGNNPVMKCAIECDFSAFPVSQIHNFDNKYSRSTCFIQCWHRWCCKWIKDLWTSNSVYIDIHPTQYHFNQQALELPHKCAHISSIVSLAISMSLFLHSCWLIVQIIPCDSVVFFLPLLWLCSAYDMSIEKLMLSFMFFRMFMLVYQCCKSILWVFWKQLVY